jgi:hypothetical protein
MGYAKVSFSKEGVWATAPGDHGEAIAFWAMAKNISFNFGHRD